MQDQSVTGLPPPQRHITAHTADGKSVFDGNIPTDVPAQVIGDINFYLMYTTDNFPVNMTDEEDVGKYRKHLDGTKPGITKRGGTVLRMCDFPPQNTAYMHRTVSLDYGTVLAGEIEGVMDSGETRLLKMGDVVIQRATNHAWRNPSKDKWAPMAFILQESQPLILEGKELKEEYGDIPDLAPSS